jgi:hypothetical protein
MSVITTGEVRPARREITRNPLVCATVTAILATTFWLGIVWMAQQITL